MNKRGLINWAIWIGVVSGIYCAIYAVTIGAYTDNILPGWHIIYVTFTALPIYFTAGAQAGGSFGNISAATWWGSSGPCSTWCAWTGSTPQAGLGGPTWVWWWP